MATTLFLRDRAEARAAADIARMFGYETDSADVWSHDRYVMNIAERLAGGDLAGRETLWTAIEAEILRIREQPNQK